MTIKTISGAELKLRLQDFINTLEDDAQVSFGSGDLTLYRVEDRGVLDGVRMVQIEFDQAYKVTAD